MRDDHIQGILFSQTNHIDLTTPTNRERLFLKLKASKTYLSERRVFSPVILAHANSLRNSRKRRAQQNHDNEIKTLSTRLKVRSY